MPRRLLKIVLKHQVFQSADREVPEKKDMNTLEFEPRLFLVIPHCYTIRAKVCLPPPCSVMMHKERAPDSSKPCASFPWQLMRKYQTFLVTGVHQCSSSLLDKEDVASAVQMILGLLREMTHGRQRGAAARLCIALCQEQDFMSTLDSCYHYSALITCCLKPSVIHHHSDCLLCDGSCSSTGC